MLPMYIAPFDMPDYLRLLPISNTNAQCRKQNDPNEIHKVDSYEAHMDLGRSLLLLRL